jgi:hypothetical protein
MGKEIDDLDEFAGWIDSCGANGAYIYMSSSSWSHSELVPVSMFYLLVCPSPGRNVNIFEC